MRLRWESPRYSSLGSSLVQQMKVFIGHILSKSIIDYVHMHVSVVPRLAIVERAADSALSVEIDCSSLVPRVMKTKRHAMLGVPEPRRYSFHSSLSRVCEIGRQAIPYHALSLIVSLPISIDGLRGSSSMLESLFDVKHQDPQVNRNRFLSS